MVEEVNQESVVSTTYVGENKWISWTDEQKAARKQEILDMARAYSHYTDKTDQFRHECASSYGGFWLLDTDKASLLRSAVTEIFKVSRVIFVAKSLTCIDGGGENHEW